MSDDLDLSTLALVDVLDELPEMGFVYRDDGILMALNTKCEELLELKREWVIGSFNLFENEAMVGAELLEGYRAAFAGEARVVGPTQLHLGATAELELNTRVHWVQTTIVPLARRPDGSARYLLGMQRDVTAQQESLEEIAAQRHELESKQATIDSLEAARREIETQRMTIEALSTPVIEVWEGILTLPLLGHFNDERIDQMTSQVLDAVVRTGARYIILDFTGIAALEVNTAAKFLRVVSALGLLGARGVLVGIMPALAQPMAEASVDFSNVSVYQNLRQALKACMRQSL